MEAFFTDSSICRGGESLRNLPVWIIFHEVPKYSDERQLTVVAAMLMQISSLGFKAMHCLCHLPIRVSAAHSRAPALHRLDAILLHIFSQKKCKLFPQSIAHPSIRLLCILLTVCGPPISLRKPLLSARSNLRVRRTIKT